MSNPRPYAEQARALCTESDEYHDRVWFCTWCRVLEQRLTPVTDVIRDLIDDAHLSITSTSAVDAASAERAGAVSVQQAAPAPAHSTP